MIGVGAIQIQKALLHPSVCFAGLPSVWEWQTKQTIHHNMLHIDVLTDGPMNKPETSNEPLSWEEFVAEFYRLLGRLVCAHATFDRNIGHQLHWLGRWYGTDVVEFLDPKKVPFSKRLKKLRSMVLDIYESAGKKGLAELTEFFDQAGAATALRNDYVHGFWNWHYRESAGGEMVLQFFPLHWDMTPDRPDDSVTMALGEFADQVENAEKVLSRYFRLIDKYGRFAKVPPGQ